MTDLINVPKKYLITDTRPNDDGTPHIELDKRGYHLVSWERGIEISRQTTENINEFLYWIFNEMTYQMAIDYERKNRIPNKDHRRIIHKNQLELLRTVDTNFYHKKKDEIDNILKEYPYEDKTEQELDYKSNGLRF